MLKVLIVVIGVLLYWHITTPAEKPQPEPQQQTQGHQP